MKKHFLSLTLILLSFLSKAQLQLSWLRTERDIPTVTGFNQLEDFVLDQNSNIYVNGTIDSFQTVVPIFISYDSAGNERWRRTINGLGLDFSWRAFKSNADHIVFAGKYEDQTGTNNMIYVEYNYSGDSIGGGILDSPGFNTGDDLRDLCLDNTGNIFLSGEIKVGNDFPAAVARFDTGSVFRWLSSYPILPGWSSGDVRAIEMIGDTGMYCLTFNFTGYASLLYCDTAGAYQWGTTLPISINDYHSVLATDPNGNAIAGGNYSNTFGIVKVNPSGDTLWSKAFSYPGLVTASAEVVNVKTDSIGNIFVLGVFNGFNPYSILAKFDSNGTVMWMDTARSLDHVYGMNKDFMEVKNGLITFTTTHGGSHIYRYNENGQRLIDEPLVLTGLISPEVNAIESRNSSIYIVGNCYNGFNVRLGFVAKLDDNITSVDESGTNLFSLLYPNPSHGTVNIDLEKLNFIPREFEIYSLNGSLVKRGVFRSEHLVYMNELNQGTYFLKLFNEKNSFVGRVDVF